MTATKFQSPAFPAIKFPHLAGVILPPLHRVRIKHPEAPALQNLEKTVDDALESFRHLQQIPKRSEDVDKFYEFREILEHFDFIRGTPP